MTAFTRRFALLCSSLLFSTTVWAATPYLVDGDGDAVSDEIDECPYNHPGVQVDAKGCPLSREDGDLDGVSDTDDDCPYSTAGARVDARGCALDSDFDGVADGIDRCPRSGLALPVDARGCATGERAETMTARAPRPAVPAPVPAAPPVKPRPIVPQPQRIAAPEPVRPAPPAASPIIATAAPAPATPVVAAAPPAPVAAAAETPQLVLRFNTNSTRMSTSDLALVESYARIFSRRLAGSPSQQLRITAYADSRETDVAGLVLARAAIVRTALLQKGIGPERIKVESGVLRDGDATRNRRVEVKLGD